MVIIASNIAVKFYVSEGKDGHNSSSRHDKSRLQLLNTHRIYCKHLPHGIYFVKTDFGRVKVLTEALRPLIHFQNCCLMLSNTHFSTRAHKKYTSSINSDGCSSFLLSIHVRSCSVQGE